MQRTTWLFLKETTQMTLREEILARVVVAVECLRDFAWASRSASDRKAAEYAADVEAVDHDHCPDNVRAQPAS